MKKLFAFLLASAMYGSAVYCQSDETAKILAVEKNTADAFTKHNIIYLNAVFADDASIIIASGKTLTRQELIQNVANINSVVVSNMQVKIKGTIAIVTGLELETGKNNAGAYSNKYAFTDVLEKVKGQWQFTATQLTSVDEQ